MTQEEKAKELVNQFRKYVDFTNDDFNTSLSHEMHRAKQCALIVINREIKLINQIIDNYHGFQDIRTPVKLFKDVLNPLIKEKQEVKNKIQSI